LREAEDDPLGRWLVLTNRGAARAQRRDLDGAAADLEEAIRIRPDDPAPYVNVAQVYAARKDYEPAVAVLTRAIELRSDAGLYHTRAQIQMLRQNRVAACEDFKRAIGLTPKDNVAERLLSDYVQLAHLQHQAGEYQEALDSCQEALQLDA